MALLEATKVNKAFGGVSAVKDFDLEVAAGEMVGLVGPNGAGKTTLFNLVAGFLLPDSGRIVLEGKDITGLPPHRIAAKGLARTFQITELFPESTVLENVRLGSYLRVQKNMWHNLFRRHEVTKAIQQTEAELSDNLEILELAQVKKVPARELPSGLLRRLGVAIALASRPVILLLDEPASGLNPVESIHLMDAVRRICKERNTACLIVEHHVAAVMRVCDRVSVMDLGIKLAEGTPAEVQANQLVIDAYLGKKHAASLPV